MPKVTVSIPALDFVNLLSKFYFPICLTAARCHDVIEHVIFRLFIYKYVIFETCQIKLILKFKL